MLKRSEAVKILTKINIHHGNMPIDPFAVETFLEEIEPTATYQECLAAVREHYANDATGKWVTSGMINAIIKQHRRANMPSEAQLQEELHQLETQKQVTVSPEQSIWYKKARVAGYNVTDAITCALYPSSTQRHAITPKPKQEISWRSLAQATTSKHQITAKEQ